MVIDLFYMQLAAAVVAGAVLWAIVPVFVEYWKQEFVEWKRAREQRKQDELDQFVRAIADRVEFNLEPKLKKMLDLKFPEL